MMLKIADDLSLPLETLTQALGILAKRRAGKSYLMRRLVEQLLKARQQVVIVDPKGDQWGVTYGSNGKSPGIPVFILGGERGKLPLEASSGEVVAKLVVEERVNVLLDLSMFRKHEVATFMTAFLENLYRLKAKEIYRTPMMLVLDEADSIAPQKPQKGEERMLGAAEDIVRRGGQRGIGCTLVTQRSAVLNKNVLTQVQILVALRTIAPQDLAAMKAWVDVHGTLEQQKILMESLPSLPTGDAWFWSPGWPDEKGIFKRVHVLPIETFDSGATPKPGEKRIEPKNAADVDLDALKKQMAATIQRAKENDPSELKKQLRDLKTELEREKKKQPVKEKFTYDPKEAERLAKQMLAPKMKKVHKYLDEVKAFLSRYRNVNKLTVEQVIGLSGLKMPLPPEIEKLGYTPTPVSSRESKHEVSSETILRGTKWEKPPIPKAQNANTEIDVIKLGAGARRLLGVLIGWYPNAIPEGQWRSLAGLRKTGTYTTYKSALRSSGLIEQTSEGFKATEKAVGEHQGLKEDRPTNTEDVILLWSKKLGAGARRMLDVLKNHEGEFITEDQLLEESGLRKTGTYTTYKSQLRTAHLILTDKGMIAANKETLFL